MPDLSRFFGIVIRMYFEADSQHRRPHFHADYGGAVGVFAIDPVDHMAGDLPIRQRRLVEAWAELHGDELIDAWRRLQSGRAPRPIAPLG